MEVCHAGHLTRFLGYGRSYCDCGADNCDLSKQSEELANKLLKESSSSLEKSVLALDEDGRILGTKDSGLSIPSFEVRADTVHTLVVDSFYFQNCVQSLYEGNCEKQQHEKILK